MSKKFGFQKEKLNEWLLKSRRGRDVTEEVETHKPFELEVAIQLIQIESQSLLNKLGVLVTNKNIDEKQDRRTIGYDTDKKRLEGEMVDYENLREIIAGVLEQKRADNVRTA